MKRRQLTPREMAIIERADTEVDRQYRQRVTHLEQLLYAQDPDPDAPWKAAYVNLDELQSQQASVAQEAVFAAGYREGLRAGLRHMGILLTVLGSDQAADALADFLETANPDNLPNKWAFERSDSPAEK